MQEHSVPYNMSLWNPRCWQQHQCCNWSWDQWRLLGSLTRNKSQSTSTPKVLDTWSLTSAIFIKLIYTIKRVCFPNTNQLLVDKDGWTPERFNSFYQPHNYKWCIITYHQSSDTGRINCLLNLLLNTLKLPLLFPSAQISGSKSSVSITWVHSLWSRSHQHLKVPAVYCSKISETTAETEPINIDSLRSLNIMELLEYDCIYRSHHAWKVPRKWFPFRFWFM